MGLGKLAKAVVASEDKKEEALDLVDRLARELAYIEGLRDRYVHARRIMDKLNQVANLHSTERHFVDEIQRCKILMQPPVKDFTQIFEQVDEQSVKLVPMLKAFNKQVVFIRDVRDELHQKMLIWDEAIEKWDFDLSHKSKQCREAVQFTYRFVAFNFPQNQDWF